VLVTRARGDSAHGLGEDVLVARVVPDVSGIDKIFDYSVPADLGVQLGDRVRVPLAGRRVGGWVVRLGPPAAGTEVDAEALKPIAKVTGRGPDRSMLSLVRWASDRWGAGRVRPFLVAASPPGAVRSLPPARYSATPVPEPDHPRAAALLGAPRAPIARAHADIDHQAGRPGRRAPAGAGGGVLLTTPAEDPLPIVLAAGRLGPALVVCPAVDDAKLLAARLRRAGRVVAVVPGEWAAAAGGVDVVIGARGAAWAPCPGLAACVVLDEHDEALQEERTPTWHARDVLAERARRAGVPFLAVSPAPTVTATVVYGGGRAAEPSRVDVRAGWPVVEIVDRSDAEHRSLVTSALVRQLRDDAKTVVCVTNSPGRARLLACRSCKTIQRCEVCDAAVAQADDGTFACARCGTVRPAVCQHCGATAFANLRPGVTRLREELEAAAQRPVVAVTGASTDLPAAGVYVGTEAVLHRVRHADVVAFLDIDAELLAPRYRAAEQAMTLLVRAARLLGPRSGAGRLLVQTTLPHHEVLQAALLADPARIVAGEWERRQALRFPPAAALAAVSGAGAAEYAASLRATALAEVSGTEASGFIVRARDWATLGAALAATPRPPRSRLRIEVDPPRL
jgi:primosomal protein N' (replication factor Y)